MSELAEVFLVEDSLGDVVLFQAILKTRKIHLNLTVFRDGTDVLSHFNTPDSNVAPTIPDLILLDYNLPKTSGGEVLEFLRAAPALNAIPVVMFSGSEASRDEQQARALGALDFVIKPLDEVKLAAAVEDLPGVNFVNRDEEWHLLRSIG
ncbi:MAG: response regulator [Halioglobus sp.]